MNTEPFIYLASQSPRRQELLTQVGVPFQLLLADASEDAEALEASVPGETPDHYVQRVTTLKAGAAVLRRRVRGLPEALILAADTTVVLGRSLLGKPDDELHATDMLRCLSGRSHRVLTAVALTDGARLELALSVSHVRFATLTEQDIAAYVATDWQSGRVCHSGPRGRLHQQHRGQSFGHHGTAAV